MADSRTVITGASVAVALLCAGWAIYSSKHPPSAAGGMGGGRPGAAAGAGPAGGRPQGGGGAGGVGGGGGPILVVAKPARIETLSVSIEALGTANANESVDVTAKV